MSRETSAWMPLYVSDYLRDTMHLSTTEHGAYMLLIMHAWTHNGLLPRDETRLARIAGMTPKEWKVSRATLLEFFTTTDDGFRHARIDREITKAEAMVEQRRAAGRSSAAARKEQREVNDRSTSVATDEQRNGRPAPSPTQLAEASSASAPEIVGWVGDIARAAGVETTEPGRIAEQNILVRSWIEAGADPAMIIETVQRCAASAKAKPKVLRYFDGAVRDAIEAKGRAATDADRLVETVLKRKVA